MRRSSGNGPRAASSYARAAVLTGALAVTATAAVGTTSRAGAAVTELAGPAFHTVTYGQVRFDVPASWPVYDLATAPSTCVRFDRPAVYLGTPGPDQNCPAHAVGRSVAVLVTPDVAGTARAAVAEPPPAADAVSGIGVRDVPKADVSVSVAYGAQNDPTAARILSSVRVAGAPSTRSAPLVSPSATAQVPSPTASPPPSPTTTTPAPTATPAPATGAAADARLRALAAPNLFAGTGFDACTAPSAGAMRAWLTSPYRAVGAYIGGVNRACGDGNLSSGWVTTVAGQGWRVLPIYVGEQAPCVFQSGLTTIAASNASGQGARAADDAASAARGFALGPGSAVYFDLEAYKRGGTCTATVLAFLSGWTQRLHHDGYRSGVYSSASSGITDLATTPASARPDAIWIARWDNSRSLFGDPAVPNSAWASHQRIKQYQGGHVESHGSVKIDIDSDALDAPLAVVR